LFFLQIARCVDFQASNGLIYRTVDFKRRNYLKEKNDDDFIGGENEDGFIDRVEVYRRLPSVELIGVAPFSYESEELSGRTRSSFTYSHINAVDLELSSR